MAFQEDDKFDKYAFRPLNDGATEHKLTDGGGFRAHLDKKGEYDAEVYEWKTTKLPEEQVLSMDTVEHIIKNLYALAQELYSRNPTATETETRERLVQISTYASFFRTHPRLFLLISAKEVSDRELYHICELVAMKRLHKQRGLTLEQQTADVSSYFKHNFVRPALPGEEEEAVANGTGLRGTIVRKNKQI